jgi:hypothetical protein
MPKNNYTFVSIMAVTGLPNSLVIKVINPNTGERQIFYTHNQFEIDGSVAVELYVKSEESDHIIFSFKGNKDEFKRFVDKFSLKSIGSEKGKSNLDIYKGRLYKLGKNLSEEALNYNNKRHLPKSTAKPVFNRSIITEAPKKSAERKKIVKAYIKKENTKNMATKKVTPKKKVEEKPKAKVTIKVTSKKPLTLAEKKKLVRKVLAGRSFLQSGGTNIEVDKNRTALPVGVRISKKGNRYTETRANRSDRKQGGKRGTWL